MKRAHRRGLTRAFAAIIATLGLVLAGCTAQGGTAQGGLNRPDAAGAGTRPNILYILTDDLSWNLVKYMPHVQAMQREGTTLSNFYVVDSLCCPSRSAILTGEFPHNNGVFTNGGSDGGYHTFVSHKDQLKTFGLAMQKSGYRTGFMGKYLNRYEPTDPVPPGWDTWDVAGNGYAEYDYRLNENGTTVSYGNGPKAYLTTVLQKKATGFLDHVPSSGKPFMLEVATFAPHRPSTPAPADAGTFPELTAPRTPAYGVKPTDPPAWLAPFPPLTAQDDADIDQQFRLRVESVQAVDRMIGHLEKVLREKGLARDTYIVFGSDNGYHMGEHDLRPGKQTAFDTDIHVPLMVTGPGVPSGRTVSALISSIDLAPTFETLAGAPVPSSCDGVSLAGIWHGDPAPPDWQQAVLIEHHGPDTTKNDPDKPGKLSGDPVSYEAVRTADALYVHYADGSQEYYDTAADPDELHNLIQSVPPATLARLQRAERALSTCRGSRQCQAAARLEK